MRFDPMTGEPIPEEPLQSTGGGGQQFDPQTGQPIGQDTYRGGQRFDPQTGQPIGQNTYGGGQRFDPQTGQPIGQNTYGGGQRFDPQTGQPIGQNTGGGRVYADPSANDWSQEEDVPRFDPETGEPLGTGGRKFTLKKWMIAIPVVAVAAAVGITVGAKSGIVLGDSAKVALAASNTFSDAPEVVQSLDSLSLLSDDSYTISVDADVEDYGVSVVFANKSGEKYVSGDVSMYGFGSIEFQAALDSDSAKLQIPALSDSIFVYDYTEQKNGYIVEVLEEAGLDIDMIDQLCEIIVSEKEQTAQMKELKSIVTDAYKSLDFESASSAKYEVDGSYRECKGYTTVIDASVVRDLLGDIEDFADNYYGSLLEFYELYYGESVFDELEYALDYMPDVEVTFYLYDNELACIALEAEGEEIEVIFHGGDSRMDNIEVLVDDYTVFELVTETDGSESVYTVIADGMLMGTMTYDSDTGAFNVLVFSSYDGDVEMAVSGSIESSKNGLTVAVDQVSSEDMSVSVDVTVSFTKGADALKFSGDEFDIGNATEEELYEMVEEFSYFFN